jgi:hypothetical protein
MLYPNDVFCRIKLACNPREILRSKRKGEFATEIRRLIPWADITMLMSGN